MLTRNSCNREIIQLLWSEYIRLIFLAFLPSKRIEQISYVLFCFSWYVSFSFSSKNLEILSLEKRINRNEVKSCLKKGMCMYINKLMIRSILQATAIGWKYFYWITSLDHFIMKWYHIWLTEVIYIISLHWYGFSSQLYHMDTVSTLNV